MERFDGSEDVNSGHDELANAKACGGVSGVIDDTALRREECLIVGQVHVENVEFDGSHCVQQQHYIGHGDVISRHVEQDAAMSEARLVNDENNAHWQHA